MRAKAPVVMPRRTSPSGNYILRRAIMLTLAGALGAILLDRFTPLDSCEYDACRYVQLPELTIEPDDLGIITAPPSTVLMHALYGNAQIPGYPFLSSFAKNLLILLALLPLVGAHPLLSSPLAMSFVWLPGKESLLVLGVMLATAMHHDKGSRVKQVLRALLATVLIAASRFPFLFVFVFAYLLERALARRRLVAFALLVCAGIAGTLLLSNALALSELMTAGLEQESSVAAFSTLRTLTFGFSVTGILLRAVIYFAYLFFLPLVEAFRFAVELPTIGLLPFHLFLLGATVEFATLSRHCSLPTRLRLFLVTAIAIGCAFSFVHTRYLLPIVLLFIGLQAGPGRALLPRVSRVEPEPVTQRLRD